VTILVLGWLSVLPSTGCRESGSAREAYEEYLQSLERAPVNEAFELLSDSSRERLRLAERHWRAEIADPLAPQDPPPDDPSGDPTGLAVFRYWVKGPGPEGSVCLPAHSARAIRSIHEDGDHAVVDVETPLGAREAILVREQGRWRVALSLAAEPGGAAPEGR
jgi:hypothetical protein